MLPLAPDRHANDRRPKRRKQDGFRIVEVEIERLKVIKARRARCGGRGNEEIETLLDVGVVLQKLAKLLPHLIENIQPAIQLFKPIVDPAAKLFGTLRRLGRPDAAQHLGYAVLVSLCAHCHCARALFVFLLAKRVHNEPRVATVFGARHQKRIKTFVRIARGGPSFADHSSITARILLIRSQQRPVPTK